jgi:deoxycytidine triphosphate deaminase
MAFGMMLNRDQIVAKQIISGNFAKDCLRDAGYDLRIDTLIGRKENGEMVRYSDEFSLPPQGIVAVVSKEVLTLPKDVCAYASVKTSLCRQGVLAINIGVVDPGWNAPLSSILLNFGKDPYCLRAGDVFLRLTFHSMMALTTAAEVTIDREAYEKDIEEKFKRRLAETFMDFDRAAEKSSKKFLEDFRQLFLKYVPVAAIGLALLTFLLNYSTLTLASRVMPQDVVELRARALTEDLSKQTEDLKKDNAALREQLNSLSTKLDHMTHK